MATVAFTTNLQRHVYMTYGTELLLETTLQLDAAGDPKYIVTLGRPTIGWSGERNRRAVGRSSKRSRNRSTVAIGCMIGRSLAGNRRH